jgi:hypothetical protein
MRALYNIERELNELNEILVNSGGELTPEIETRLAISQTELQEKSINYAYIIKQNQAESDAIETEIKRLKAIKDSLDSTNDKLKETISFSMQTYGITEVKTTALKLSFRKSESVDITDESLLDAKYFSYKPTIDKTAIKSDLKAGVLVEGATIISKDNLQIK